VLKADVPGLVHKADAGGVELGLRTEADVRAAYRRLTERFGVKLHAVLVQPMIGGGTEVIVGVTDDHLFGPLVVDGRRCGPASLSQYRSHRATVHAPAAAWPAGLSRMAWRAAAAVSRVANPPRRYRALRAPTVVTWTA